MWAQIAQAVLKVAKGARTARKANNQALQQEVAGLQDEQGAWANNLADNQAIADANVQNTIRAGYRAGILNMQRAHAKQEQAQQGFSLGRNVRQVLSASTANAAASGTVGQSVDAVLSDVQEKADEVEGRLVANSLQTEANFDLQVHDLVQAGQDALGDSAKSRIRATPKATRVGFGEVLVGVAADMGSQYLTSQMSLGGKGGAAGGAMSGGGGGSLADGAAMAGYA